MTEIDRADIAEGLAEEKRDRDIAFDYRELPAKDFFEKYGTLIEDDEGVSWELDNHIIKSIDAGLDSLLFTPK